MQTLSLRSLNRTVLRRQLLDQRTTRPVLDVVQHLVAMQGQEPNGPYLSLWARVDGFHRDDLAARLADRRLVRSTMIRATVHLASAEDFRWLRPTVQAVVRRLASSAYYASEIDGIDLDELAAAGRTALAGIELTRPELGKRLRERFDDRLPKRLADTVELLHPLVHTPRAAAWGNRSRITVTLAEDWIGAPMAEPAPDTLVARYLAAFGPASVMDVQNWSGLTRLREIVERMDLVTYRSEDGGTLYDLPEAALAEEDAPVPVRFLPAFDNALLGHKDRRRMISDTHRERFAKVASAGVPMFLIDGFVAGTWTISDSALLVSPFRPLAKAVADDVIAEGRRLLEFLSPDGGAGEVQVVADGSIPAGELHAAMRL